MGKIKDFFGKKQNKILSAGIGTELALTGANFATYTILQGNEYFENKAVEWFFQNYDTRIGGSATRALIEGKTLGNQAAYIGISIGVQLLAAVPFGLTYLKLYRENKKLQKKINEKSELEEIMLDEVTVKETMPISEERKTYVSKTSKNIDIVE